MQEFKACAYRVRLVATNATGRSTYNMTTNVSRDVLAGVAIIVTDEPRRIYDAFGQDQVLSVERLGPGYALMP